MYIYTYLERADQRTSTTAQPGCEVSRDWPRVTAPLHALSGHVSISSSISLSEATGPDTAASIHTSCRMQIVSALAKYYTIDTLMCSSAHTTTQSRSTRRITCDTPPTRNHSFANVAFFFCREAWTAIAGSGACIAAAFQTAV